MQPQRIVNAQFAGRRKQFLGALYSRFMRLPQFASSFLECQTVPNPD
jgi:hypothetical protein